MTGSDRPGEPAGAPAGIDQPPPFWSRWSQLYGFVAGVLVAFIALGWLLTRWAS